MAHNIGEMFYFGEHPWHGLGNELSHPANLEEALSAGGLDWKVELAPMTLAGDRTQAVITHRRAVVRTDRALDHPGRVVGVVHPKFRPLQNRDGMAMFDALVGRGERIYQTGGYLGDGEVVWLQARLPTDINVGANDVVEPYLLYSNSHDGSRAIDIRLTTVRVVCQNTLSMALDERTSRLPFRRAHRYSTEVLRRESKEFAQFALRQCALAQQLFVRLSRAKCETPQFERFLQSLLPDPKRPASADKNSAVRKGYDTCVESIQAARRGVGTVLRDGIPERRIPPGDDNWWDALNAVTAWVDHVQEIKGDRFAHSTFGSGNMLKTKALDLAQKAIA